MTTPVAEPQSELIADTTDAATISINQPAALKPASPLADVDTDISAGEVQSSIKAFKQQRAE